MHCDKEEKEMREYIKCDSVNMNIIRKMLDIKQTKCFYCKKEINFENDKFSIFNKPTRLVCSDIFCMAETIEDEE